MRFDKLDTKMRVFETAHDHLVLPGLFMVARLDGRGFTRLTKQRLDLERPFDTRFRDAMLSTLQHLMGCGFRVSYAYTESDEISLLFERNESTFGRKLRKLHSILAGEASGKLSLELGLVAAFDCRISQLPTEKDVVDYFRWRQADAQRNALNAYCYWTLRQRGLSASAASSKLVGASVAHKSQLLFESGTSFNQVPCWQKRGIAAYWKRVEKDGLNPKTGEVTTAKRRRLVLDSELPLGDAYATLVNTVLQDSQRGVHEKPALRK